MTTREIVPFNANAVLDMAVSMRTAVLQIKDRVLTKDIDYGVIVTGGKPTLLKPGAEKLASSFKLTPKYNIISQIEDWRTPFIFYRYECVLVERETGLVWGSGIGSCNSNEGKYGWRWVSVDRVPPNIDPSTLAQRGGKISEFTFAVDEAKTEGPYSKSAEYWQRFKDAIANGMAEKIQKKMRNGQEKPAWQIEGTEYRIPNIDVFDAVNTIDKMAQKRALVSAVLVATNASEFFSQDIEDFETASGNTLLDTNRPVVVTTPDPKPTLTNGHGEPREMPLPKEASTATTDDAPADDKPTPPDWWLPVTRRYAPGRDKDARDAFGDKAKALLAVGTLAHDTLPETAFLVIVNALQEEADAGLIVDADKIPLTWAIVVRAVARHMEGDIDAAKQFIREAIDRFEVSPTDSADKARLKLTAILAKMAIDNGTMEPIEALLATEEALPEAAPVGVDGGTEADPFLDLRK